MILCQAELISGCSFGFEFVSGADCYEDDDSHYLSIDLLIFRILLEFTHD
jgi:phage head maturation protease